MQLRPAMQHFVRDLVTLVRANRAPSMVDLVAERLAELLREEDLLEDRFNAPDAATHGMEPVWLAPDGCCSVAVAIWQPGHTTAVHDHTTWRAVGVYRGVEHEVRYAPNGRSSALRIVAERDIPAGEVVVGAPPDDDVHAVGSGSDQPCVSIHVYGADLGAVTRHTYDLNTGLMQPLVTDWPSEIPLPIRELRYELARRRSGWLTPSPPPR